MRRSVARGRVFPQSFSTDRRYGRLSLKALALFPLMWSNADDQGRLGGDPEEIKYAVCPNIDHITKADIPTLLQEFVDNELILHYNTSKTSAIQLLDWWEVQRLQWAYPSEYAPPNGWKDRLRYKKGREQVITENWGDSPELSPVSTPEHSPELAVSSPLTTPFEKENEKGKGTRRGRGRGRGNSPESSGEKPPSPSPRASPSESEILARLTECFEKGWGRVKASDPDKIIPRRAAAKETAQLRDLAKELSSAGVCPLAWIDEAFHEAAGQQKMHISYVRAMLLDWMGVERNRSP